MLVIPSLMDNYPTIIQEAFANKLPVIASNVGGIPELVSNMKNGILVKPGMVNELSEAMQLVINNKEILQDFQNNIPLIKSMHQSAVEYLNEYKNLLGIESHGNNREKYIVPVLCIKCSLGRCLKSCSNILKNCLRSKRLLFVYRIFLIWLSEIIYKFNR